MAAKVLSVIAFIGLSVLYNANCKADSNEDAVKSAVHQHKQGDTDVDGDGLIVMPVTVTADGKAQKISGQILHTWRHFDPTPITYDVTVSEDGTVTGTIVVKCVDNPDGHAIKSDKSGTISGTVSSIKCDILMEHSAMRGAIKLIGMVISEVKK